MKLLGNLFMVAILAMAISCSNDNSSNLGPAPQPINPNAVTTQPNAAVPGAQAVVQHYICPNNCANSGGPTAGTCPVCGTAYMHNAAYHNQPGATNNNPQNATPQTPSPAQNAAGVYHYTCPSGHEGGAGSAQPCAVCGAMLVHNQAYHNTAATPTTSPNTTVTNGSQKSPLYINNN